MKYLMCLVAVITCLGYACKNRSGSWTQPPPPTPEYEVDTNAVRSVSLIALIANPEKFNGKKVRVIGYLHFEFEGNVIYINKEAFAHSISKNGLWVGYKTRKEVKPVQHLSDHYVIMEGVFDAKDQGHEGANSGSIQQIIRLELWDTRR